jgi:hypothetical protein
LEHDARLVLGSDAPVESVNAWWGIHAAVTRKDRADRPVGGFRPKERLELRDAVRGFSSLARDVVRGVHSGEPAAGLAVGGQADFTVVTPDPFSLPESELHAVRTVRTVVAGRTVYGESVEPGD